MVSNLAHYMGILEVSPWQVIFKCIPIILVTHVDKIYIFILVLSRLISQRCYSMN